MGAQAPQEGQGASREDLLPEGRRGRPFPRKESKGMKGQRIPAMGGERGAGSCSGGVGRSVTVTRTCAGRAVDDVVGIRAEQGHDLSPTQRPAVSVPLSPASTGPVCSQNHDAAEGGVTGQEDNRRGFWAATVPQGRQKREARRATGGQGHTPGKGPGAQCLRQEVVPGAEQRVPRRGPRTRMKKRREPGAEGTWLSQEPSEGTG